MTHDPRVEAVAGLIAREKYPGLDWPQSFSERYAATCRVRATTFLTAADAVAPPVLWAVHSIGADEVWAMPDYDTAIKNAWALARDPRLQRRHPYDPEVFAVPIIWDGTPEEHAENLTKQGGADKIREVTAGYFQRVMQEREAALTAAPQSQWRDIKDAPRDGTEILICDAREGVFIASWDDTEQGSGWYVPYTYQMLRHATRWALLPSSPEGVE